MKTLSNPTRRIGRYQYHRISGPADLAGDLWSNTAGGAAAVYAEPLFIARPSPAQADDRRATPVPHRGGRRGGHWLLRLGASLWGGVASGSPTAESGVYKLHKLYVLPRASGKRPGKGSFCNTSSKPYKPEGASFAASQRQTGTIRPRPVFMKKMGFAVVKEEEDVAIGNNYFMNDYVMEIKGSGG